MKELIPAHTGYDLAEMAISTVLASTIIDNEEEANQSLSEYIYMQVEELATFLGYLGHSLVMGSGTLRIIIDPWQRRVRSERYMSLEKAVSLYNQRSNSYAYRELTPVIKRRVTQYPNTSLKLDIQRNSKCKYGLCSSLFGGVPAK